MGIDLIFRIAAIGILVAVLNEVLSRSGKAEYAMMTTLTGVVIVLLMVVKQIVNLFDVIKTMFSF